MDVQQGCADRLPLADGLWPSTRSDPEEELEEPYDEDFEEALRQLEALDRDTDTPFANECRWHVSAFETIAFIEFDEAGDPEAAYEFATKEDVFNALRELSAMEECPSKHDATTMDKYCRVRSRWLGVVKELGLDSDAYAAVREFMEKGEIGEPFIADPRIALKVLQAGTSVPKDVKRYQKPLIQLLEALTS